MLLALAEVRTSIVNKLKQKGSECGRAGTGKNKECTDMGDKIGRSLAPSTR